MRFTYHLNRFGSYSIEDDSGNLVCMCFELGMAKRLVDFYNKSM